jgi:hypothetical protein
MFRKPTVTQNLEPSTSSTKVFESSLKRCVILIILNYLIPTQSTVCQDDGQSPWLKFARGVLDGLYKSQTLLGMVEAFVIKADRIGKGKSLRNMKYNDTFSNFCNLLASTSAQAYETFRRHFGGRMMRSIRSA